MGILFWQVYPWNSRDFRDDLPGINSGKIQVQGKLRQGRNASTAQCRICFSLVSIKPALIYFPVSLGEKIFTVHLGYDTEGTGVGCGVKGYFQKKEKEGKTTFGCVPSLQVAQNL